jgi:hypothetical protein
MLFGENE